MDEKQAIEFLKQELAEIARLRGLPCGSDGYNNDFKLWRYNVLDVIETAFGKNSSEYNRIPTMPIESLTFHKTEAQIKQEYNELLDKHEIVLKSIIGKHEKIGLERMPVATYQKVWHLLDHLWQITVKAAFEGIVNGIKKP